MAHRSRLSNLVIDCKADDLAPRLELWSKALGKRIVDADSNGDGKDAELRTEADEPIILLQKVAHPSRAQLDRPMMSKPKPSGWLRSAPGRSRRSRRWWVMEAPSGHRFCVVRQQRKAFGPHANHWA